MTYQHIEEIQSRKGEKIALFLTVENAVGLILGALPAVLISGGMPLALRLAIVAPAAILGVLLTLELAGLSLAERLAWRARGAVRRRVSARTITPDQLVGEARVRRDRPLAAAGPIQLRPEPRSARAARRSAED